MSSSFFGAPPPFIGKKKRSLLIEAANHFILYRDLDLEVQFDIVSILKNNSKWKVEHLQNDFNFFTLSAICNKMFYNYYFCEKFKICAL